MTLQCPMVCPGLATHTLTGLCALWMPRGASTPGKFHHSIKPHNNPQTTCPARSHHTVQTPPHLLHTAEVAFDLAAVHGMSRAYHSHTGRALCAGVAERHLHILKTPAFSKTALPTNHLPRPAAAPSAPPHTFFTLRRLHLTFQWPIACPGLATHKLAGLCALWLPSSASKSGKLQYSGKPHPVQTTCPVRLQHPMQAQPHLVQTAEAIFGLAVAHGMPRATHSHNDRALCAVVAERRLHIWETPVFSKATAPTNHLPSPAAASSAGPTTSVAHSACCI